ncbi:Uncharacterised protein [Mycobacteroides abscessus subsp. massiliense]|nr:Uncharacterised protein [Mycobacteroides abscessus subsp. massiliense]
MSVWRPSWSTMVVTSSAIKSAGSRASAEATASRCNSPPDRPAVSRPAIPLNPTSVSRPSMSMSRSGGNPHTMSSPTRSPSTWLSGCCKTNAVPPTWPKPTPAGRSMLPVVGGTPAKMRMRVDLPVPLAPVTAMCSPTSTRIVTGASASRSAPAYR